ncbi:MAG TPA: amidase [Spirochaetia bacterium]|nr:amidase [Spirochaetia bacterium]
MDNQDNQADLCYLSAWEIARLIRTKSVSPVEVVDTFLERIDRINPHLNAYCTVAYDLARRRAREAEDRVVRGERCGPLHGVPIAIKDLTPTAGIRTTYGSVIFENNVPAQDSIFVERVKEAGAIVLGKTNTPEFGHKGTTDNLLSGATRNPWDTALTSGGSSGGSAAAVAAGLVPLAEGSDGGGSIRIPAALCGVYGLKPTYGRIPMDNSISRFSSHTPFLTHGPIARTVADAALLLSVVTGPDRRDPFSLPYTGEDFADTGKEEIIGLRIAYSPDLGFFEIDSGVREVVDRAVQVFPLLGCQVEMVDPGLENPAKNVDEAFNLMWCVYFAAFCKDFLPRWESRMSPGLVAMVKAGLKVSAVDYKRLDLARTALWTRMEEIFKKYDLLLTPTLAVGAFPLSWPGPSRINGKEVNPYRSWMLTYPFNMTGHPAASIPCGFTPDGLPVGLQIIGGRFAEKTILTASAAFEAALPGTRARPPCQGCS